VARRRQASKKPKSKKKGSKKKAPTRPIKSGNRNQQRQIEQLRKEGLI
jgi:hypothetical protein